MGRSGLLLVLAALGVGTAFGYVLGRRAEEEPGRGEAAAPPPAAGPAAPEPEEPGVPASPTLRDLLARLPAPEPRTGDGAIEGTVKTEAGRPLSGVLVRATARRRAERKSRRRPVGSLPPDRDLLEVVREAVWSHRRRLADRREAVTDASGAFRLEGLGDGSYSVAAFREGYLFRRKNGGGGVRAGDTLEFVARRLLSLTVRLSGPGEETPERAQVECIGGAGTTSFGWRPGKPWIELAPGTYRVRATGGEDGEYASGEKVVTLAEDGPPPTLDLVLRRVPGIRGSVVFPEGEARSYCEVAILHVPPGKTPDPSRLASSTRRDSVGGRRFRFAGLAPGTWLVGVILDARRLVAHETVQVRDRMEEVRLVVPPLDPSESVVVAVLGPGGKPLPEVSFTTHYQAEGAHSSSGCRAVKLPDGSYRLSHHTPPAGYPQGGEYGIEVRSREYGEKLVWYDRKTTRRLTVRFENPALLTVRLDGYAGSDLEGRLTLGLARVEGRSRRGGESGVRPDESGVARFKPVAPGSYELQGLVSSGPFGGNQVLSEPLLLGSGEQEVRVDLPALSTLTVLVEGMPARVRFDIRPLGGRARWWGGSGIRKEDRVVFADLPAGEYRVRAWGKKMKMEEMIVRVPEQTVVRFSPVVTDALRVRIDDPRGALAAAGLRDGDLLVGVNGEEFRSREQMIAILTLAAERGKGRLDVLRGGRRTTLEIDLGRIWRVADAGGTLESVPR